MKTPERCPNEMPDSMKRGRGGDLRCDFDVGHDGMCCVHFSGGYRTWWNEKMFSKLRKNEEVKDG